MTRPSDFLQTALAAADAAAAIHRRYAGTIDASGARLKGPADFVSHVDLEARSAAVEVIRHAFPEHRVVTEEDEQSHEVDTPRIPGGSAPLWIVDPLDGTTNYLHGHPAHAASVGVVVDGRAVAGAVVASETDERWCAAEGEGAFRNGVRIRVSGVSELRMALVGTGFPFKRIADLATFLGQVERVLPATSGIRRCGSAALDLCYLAQGSLDAFWECRLEPWDIAAGIVILTEAGGSAARIGGEPLAVERSGTVLAANGPVLLSALDALL